MRFLATKPARMAVLDLAGRSLSPRDILRLRQQWGSVHATAIAGQNAIFRAVRQKFNKQILLGTERSVQQATDTWIGHYKASRFPAGEVVFDGCCGMGGDLQCLATRGPTIGIDRDAELCIAAAANSSGAITVCDSVEHQLPPREAFIHVDPDRRPGNSRVSRPEFGSPGIDVLDSLIRRVAGAAIKLSPAAEIPETWQGSTERTWISSRGECRQQVVWFGLTDVPGYHRAVAINSSSDWNTSSSLDLQIDQFVGRPNIFAPEAATVGGFLYDLDPSVRASGLCGAFSVAHQLQSLGGPAGFLTSAHQSKSILARDTTGLVTEFEVIEVLPFDLRRLRSATLSLNLDIHEIKIRSVEQTPEQIRRLTRVPGAPSATLFVGRSTSRTFAAIAKRSGR